MIQISHGPLSHVPKFLLMYYRSQRLSGLPAVGARPYRIGDMYAALAQEPHAPRCSAVREGVGNCCMVIMVSKKMCKLFNPKKISLQFPNQVSKLNSNCTTVILTTKSSKQGHTKVCLANFSMQNNFFLKVKQFIMKLEHCTRLMKNCSNI